MIDKNKQKLIIIIIVIVAIFPLAYIWHTPQNSFSEGSYSGSGQNCYYKTEQIHRSEVIVNSLFNVDAGSYGYKTFIVEREWMNAKLKIDVKVYEGKDIDIIVLKDKKIIWESGKVGPQFSTTINLPGEGSYEIQFDNSYSIITSKTVEAKVTLEYIENEQVKVCS